jgi:hypothetical protein
VLAVWSSGPDPRFLRRLRRAGFDAAAHEVPARGVGGGPLHTIFIATMPGRQRLGNLEDRHAPHHPPR